MIIEQLVCVANFSCENSKKGLSTCETKRFFITFGRRLKNFQSSSLLLYAAKEINNGSASASGHIGELPRGAISSWP